MEARPSAHPPRRNIPAASRRSPWRTAASGPLRHRPNAGKAAADETLVQHQIQCVHGRIDTTEASVRLWGGRRGGRSSARTAASTRLRRTVRPLRGQRAERAWGPFITRAIERDDAGSAQSEIVLKADARAGDLPPVGGCRAVAASARSTARARSRRADALSTGGRPKD